MDWFYILELDLKKNLDHLIGLGLISWYIRLGLTKLINQVGMSLEKYEDFL